MKIFYKKDFYGVLEEKKNLEKEFKDYKKQNDESISALNTKCLEQIKEITKLGNEVTEKESLLKLHEETNRKNEELKSKLTHANASKGGLVKEINKLKREIEVLTEEMKRKEELLSKRYILKIIKPGRTPNTLKTSIRSSANESRAIKYVKENL